MSSVYVAPLPPGPQRCFSADRSQFGYTIHTIHGHTVTVPRVQVFKFIDKIRMRLAGGGGGGGGCGVWGGGGPRGTLKEWQEVPGSGVCVPETMLLSRLEG